VFIKIVWDEVGCRVGINRWRKAPYFTRHFAGFPALIPWLSTDSKLYHLPSLTSMQPWFDSTGSSIIPGECPRGVNKQFTGWLREKQPCHEWGCIMAVLLSRKCMVWDTCYTKNLIHVVCMFFYRAAKRVSEGRWVKGVKPESSWWPHLCL
jgi:hypothetical protein